jgi:hypothetical protein
VSAATAYLDQSWKADILAESRRWRDDTVTAWPPVEPTSGRNAFERLATASGGRFSRRDYHDASVVLQAYGWTVPEIVTAFEWSTTGDGPAAVVAAVRAGVVGPPRVAGSR